MRLAQSIVLYGFPALLAVLGTPLVLKLIPPNHYYGYRLPAAFTSRETWYQLNFEAGRAFLVAAMLCIVAALIARMTFAEMDSKSMFLVTTGLYVVVTLGAACWPLLAA
jgi:uncharacterized membrane protein